MQLKFLDFFSTPTPTPTPPGVASSNSAPSSSSSSCSLSSASEEVELPKLVKRNLEERGCPLPEFSPYSARVPWHTGPRALFSKLFPKYGHYCGPNWSSGKDGGSLTWDKRPIDWLDYCCYCHDIGYDSHNQVDLYKADLAFLECLENMPKACWRDPKGNALVSRFYRTACIVGLRTILLPYRRMLVGTVEEKAQAIAKANLNKISSKASHD